MTVDDIDRIAVLGAGTMGQGIAAVAALAGYDVTLRDTEEDLVREGVETIESSLDALAESEELSPAAAETALDHLTAVVDVEAAVAEANVVVEAGPEDQPAKEAIYAEIEEYVTDKAIIATTTASLSVTELAQSTDRPRTFCGMHFFEPPLRNDLAEVAPGAETTAATVETVAALAEDCGKTPVRVGTDSPGFVVNRVLAALVNEAAWIVHDEVASLAAVEATVTADMGHQMGLFERADRVGLDVILRVLDRLEETVGHAYAPSPLIEEKVAADDLGRKTGEGFYGYDAGDVEIPADGGREDVEMRLLASMANEVGKLRAADVATVDDVDRAMRLGADFPEGPAKAADDAGLGNLVDMLEGLFGGTLVDRYEVSDGLRQAAEEGGFHSGDASGADDEATTYENITIEYPREGVARIVLDRPQRMNAIDSAMLDDLSDVIDALEATEDSRAVVLSGAGDAAFSVGADVESLVGDAAPLEAVQFSRKGQETFGKLADCPMPVVASVDGFALGGGMELAACADLRLATTRSTFGHPEHDLGLLPGWGGTQRLSTIVGEGRAKEIIFTAERYDAAELAEYGFVNEVVADDELDQRTLDLAEDLAAGPPVAQGLTKRAMHAGRDDTEAGLEIEAQAFGHLVGTDDVVEGITAFTNDREPEFEGK